MWTLLNKRVGWTKVRNVNEGLKYAITFVAFKMFPVFYLPMEERYGEQCSLKGSHESYKLYGISHNLCVIEGMTEIINEIIFGENNGELVLTRGYEFVEKDCEFVNGVTICVGKVDL